jgi:hypothetical protein
MTSKREALKHYFVEVIRDLVTRGVIRRAAGEPLEDIIARESAVILAEIQQDFAAVGLEVVVGLGRGLELMAQKKVSEWVQAGQKVFTEFFKPGRGK